MLSLIFALPDRRSADTDEGCTYRRLSAQSQVGAARVRCAGQSKAHHAGWTLSVLSCIQYGEAASSFAILFLPCAFTLSSYARVAEVAVEVSCRSRQIRVVRPTHVNGKWPMRIVFESRRDNFVVLTLASIYRPIPDVSLTAFDQQATAQGTDNVITLRGSTDVVTDFFFSSVNRHD